MAKIGYLLFFLSLPTFLLAQKSKVSLVQFSAMVFDSDSSVVVPYATATDVSYQNRHTIANYNGYLSFVVREGDTVEISAIGYRSKKTVVPKNLPDQRYTLMVKLKPEVQTLKEVVIFPWASVEEFKREFLNMKIADDDYVIAKKNTRMVGVRAMSNQMPRDGKENFQLYSQSEQYQQLYRVSGTPNPLLNPFAWGAFLNRITQGDKSRQSDND